MASIDRHQYTEEIRKRAGKFAKDLNLESKGSGGQSVGRKENGAPKNGVLNKVAPSISSKLQHFQKLNGSVPAVSASLPRRSLGLVSSSLLQGKVLGEEEVHRQNGHHSGASQTMPRNGGLQPTAAIHDRIMNRSTGAIASFALGDTSTVDTKLVAGLEASLPAPRHATDQVTPLSRLPGQGLTLGPYTTGSMSSGLHTAEMVMISSPKPQPVVSSVLAAKVFSRQSSAEKDLVTAKQQLASRRLSVEREVSQEKILFQPGTYPGAPQESGPQIYENIESYVNPTPPPAPPPPYVGVHHIVSTGPEAAGGQRAASRLSQGSLQGRPLEELYPKLRMQRAGSQEPGMQRSASQVSVPAMDFLPRSASQMSGSELYPYLLKQRPASQLSQPELYPHLVAAAGGRLVPISSPSQGLSQGQLEELYPHLVKQQLSTSVQLSQLPGAQLSADLMRNCAIAPPPDYENVYENIEAPREQAEASQAQLYQDYVNQPPPPYPGQMLHTRNLSDTSGLSESSGSSQLSHTSPLRLGWYETDLDSSSDTLTPQRQRLGNGTQIPGLRQPLHTAALTAHTAAYTAQTAVHTAYTPHTASHAAYTPNTAYTPHTAVSAPTSQTAQSAAAAQKPLLPFSITPPRPAGPSQAEMKIEEMTRQLEEEMEKKQESEFFGTCNTCGERVTGAGQACQVWYRITISL